MFRSHSYALVALWLMALSVCLGCGDKHEGIVPVSGTVTIDGQPLTIGQVRILAKDHRAAMGRIQPDGSFTMSCFELSDGAPIGTHLATVSAVESINERSNRWHAPKKYANKVSSDLWVTIDGPTDDLKIELTWADSKQSGPFVDKF
ncbi:hypothetical protein NG895_05110 [Aeoliella sp. ICT_H6.2]|uniref:Carboxypeptidase regulatory-like domain-containing protein n=1 Tax=Aeoliella straminimaris TaxID=2954799 RepID=A0A9X2F7U4_9BACT|nr:hypothetical protein [Aeoliella straminimaris]MCO6043278.1 hypothetical protein [Aeoliella straminimaris]